MTSNIPKVKNGGMSRGGLTSTSSALNISTTIPANPTGQVNSTIPKIVSNNSSSSAGVIPVLPVNDNVTSLSDIRSYLQPINSTMALSTGVCPYDHIIEMIRGLDLQDDGITMNHKIKSIETDFCNIVRDENMLCESMDYLNDKALEDGETALKFALLFASHNFDVLAMKETKVRTAMLTLLQKNFVNAENYRQHDRERLYNSITLLGEYYHRVRLADNSPINILGESLLGLLIREIKEDKNVNDVKLAKLILSQITLNGDLMRNLHKTEISQLLYHIRKNLIEQPNLKPTVKAIMLMTLDLFYSNFASLGSQLEVMYTKYFIMEDDDEGNNNQNSNQSIQQQPTSSEPQYPKQQHQNQSNKCSQQQKYTCPSTQLQQLNSYEEVSVKTPSNNRSLENGDSGNINDISKDNPDRYKKWSEQVCEDSFEEFNGVECELNVSGSSKDSATKSYGHDREKKHSSGKSYDNDSDRQSRNFRRSFQPRQSPRPLKQNLNSNEQLLNGQNSGNEERDESKPLPRWRAPRFNRDDQHDTRFRNAQRRFSASFDDDHQSVRSDGASIRLYSINDRLKHAEEKIERSGNHPTYTGIANSNWDRQSQRDDRSERSYMSNYERGNSHRWGGSRHYNNRSTYDKPPRFQKNKNSANSHKQDKNVDTWRTSSNNLHYLDENSSYSTNGPESNSRSSSRARTLPRPAKSRIDGNHQNNSFKPNQSPNSYQRGVGGGAEDGNNYHNNTHQNKNRSPKFGSRYSSQSSLASDASSTLDRRHHQKNRSFSRRSSEQQQDRSNDAEHWNEKETNSELVRNARQTTDYMNYLSSQK